MEVVEVELWLSGDEFARGALAAIPLRLLHQEVAESARHCQAPQQRAPSKGCGTRREDTPNALHVNNTTGFLYALSFVSTAGLLIVREPHC
jgi:hypothetical protein